MIVDTSFVIDLMKNNKDAIAAYKKLQIIGEPLLVTSFTVFELFTGITRSKRPAEEKNKVINILKGQIIIPFENEAAEKAGEIDGTLAKDGYIIEGTDVMIAGICLVKNEKILTRDIKDFSKIKGLKIETY